MQQNQLILLFGILALLLYIFTYIKKRPAALFSFLGRGAAGLAFIYVFNLFCAAKDIITSIGINPLTACISAFLGIPGVLLAYAVKLWSFLP